MPEPQFDIEALIRCADREVKQREHVYARLGWTDFRRRELHLMRAIAANLRGQLDAQTPAERGRLL